MRPNIIQTTLSLGLTGLSLLSFAQKQPNIVFIIADDISWDDFGCYGNQNVKTPNIDKLATQGIRFTNFFLTASSCSPSRNSIITGRYPHNTGAAELHTEPPVEMVSFPEVLKQHGYYTALSGKFHMGEYARRGFSSISNGNQIGDGGEALWVQTLKERPKKKPFMMWLASLDAHRDWGPNNFSGTHKPNLVTTPSYLVNSEETRTDLVHYYDEITRFDHYVGLVINELKQQNVLKNTIVIVMADNGRPFPHSKTRVNDRGMKTPFIISWPNGLAVHNETCSSLVSAIDIAPTLLSLANVNQPASLQGYSFEKLLDKPKLPFRNYIFAEHNWHDFQACERMVRTTEYLYILNARPNLTNLGPADALNSPSFESLLTGYQNNQLTSEQSEIFLQPRPSEELYHNTTDPDQFNNKAEEPELLNKRNELRLILDQWMKETEDNMPEKLTPDWYERASGYQKTTTYGQRGEMVGNNKKAISLNQKPEIF